MIRHSSSQSDKAYSRADGRGGCQIYCGSTVGVTQPLTHDQNLSFGCFSTQLITPYEMLHLTQSRNELRRWNLISNFQAGISARSALILILYDTVWSGILYVAVYGHERQITSVPPSSISLTVVCTCDSGISPKTPTMHAQQKQASFRLFLRIVSAVFVSYNCSVQFCSVFLSCDPVAWCYYNSLIVTRFSIFLHRNAYSRWGPPSSQYNNLEALLSSSGPNTS